MSSIRKLLVAGGLVWSVFACSNQKPSDNELSSVTGDGLSRVKIKEVLPLSPGLELDIELKTEKRLCFAKGVMKNLQTNISEEVFVVSIQEADNCVVGKVNVINEKNSIVEKFNPTYTGGILPFWHSNQLVGTFGKQGLDLCTGDLETACNLSLENDVLAITRTLSGINPELAASLLKQENEIIRNSLQLLLQTSENTWDQAKDLGISLNLRASNLSDQEQQNTSCAAASFSPLILQANPAWPAECSTLLEADIKERQSKLDQILAELSHTDHKTQVDSINSAMAKAQNLLKLAPKSQLVVSLRSELRSIYMLYLESMYTHSDAIGEFSQRLSAWEAAEASAEARKLELKSAIAAAETSEKAWELIDEYMETGNSYAIVHHRAIISAMHHYETLLHDVNPPLGFQATLDGEQ